MFLNNTHHTRNTYIITPNVFSMEALTLINRINSIFHNLCYSNRMGVQFDTISLASVLFEKVRYFLSVT